MLGLGVSLVIFSLVPILAPAGRARTGSRAPSPGSRWSPGSCFPIGRWLLGDLEGQLLDLRLRRADDRGRRDLDDHVQRRRPARRRSSTASRPRSAAWRPCPKMSIAYPLRSLFRTGVTLAMFTLVVFTLVVGATTTGAFVNAFNDLDAFGGGFDVRAAHVRGGADRRHVARARRRARAERPATSALVASISTLAVKARQLGTSGERRVVRRPRRRRRVPRHTTYGLAPVHAATARPQAVWNALRDAPQPGRRRPVRRAAPQTNWSFAPLAEVQAQRLLPRGQDVPARSRSTVRDPQTGAAGRPDRDRRPLGQHAAASWPGSGRRRRR